MTNRAGAPLGAPCWVDLWTSDVARARRFYAELFGWEALEPSLEHGGTSCSRARGYRPQEPWATSERRVPTTPVCQAEMRHLQ